MAGLLHLHREPFALQAAEARKKPGRITCCSGSPTSFVIFVLFPLVIWTGLAMSPAVASAFPSAVTLLGGQQSARTIHFFVSVFLFLFLVVHIMMICLAGLTNRMRAMINGRASYK